MLKKQTKCWSQKYEAYIKFYSYNFSKTLSNGLVTHLEVYL